MKPQSKIQKLDNQLKTHFGESKCGEAALAFPKMGFSWSTLEQHHSQQQTGQ